MYHYTSGLWWNHAARTDVITGILVEQLFCSETAFIIWFNRYIPATFLELRDYPKDIVYLDQRYYNKLQGYNHYRRAIYVASIHGLTGPVEKLISQVENIDLSLGRRYKTALGAAARRGRAGVLRVLLEHGAKADAEIKNCGFKNALDAAVQGRHADCARLLTAAGSCANQEYYSTSLERWQSPISNAARWGYTDVIQVLIEEGADVNPEQKLDKMVAVPLIEAGCEGHLEIAQLLLANGANVNAIGDVLGGLVETPLTAAAWEGHFQVAKLFIDNGADVNFEVSDKGISANYSAPLLVAARTGQKEFVGLLLANGADVNPPYEGVEGDTTIFPTPLLAAAELGYKEIVQLLLANGADVNVKGPYGNAREAALLKGHEDIAALLLPSD